MDISNGGIQRHSTSVFFYTKHQLCKDIVVFRQYSQCIRSCTILAGLRRYLRLMATVRFETSAFAFAFARRNEPTFASCKCHGSRLDATGLGPAVNFPRIPSLSLWFPLHIDLDCSICVFWTGPSNCPANTRNPDLDHLIASVGAPITRSTLAEVRKACDTSSSIAQARVSFVCSQTLTNPTTFPSHFLHPIQLPFPLPFNS